MMAVASNKMTKEELEKAFESYSKKR